MPSITPKNGRAAFITAQGPHTYYELNSTNLGTNYGDDPASSDLTVTGADISTQESYEGMDANNNPPAGTALDDYLVNDAAMLLYIPAGLAHDTVRGIFHNGGGTNGQGLMIRATTTGVEIACGHNNGNAASQDCVIEEIPDADLPGWFCVSCQFNSHGGVEGDMALWVNGTAVRSGTRTYTLDWGSGNPQIGDANHAEPDAAACLDPSSYGGGDWGADNTIDSTGILIANFTADNPSDGASDTSAGNGNTWHTDYYDEHVTTSATINNETLQDLTSVAVADVSVGLRLRDRNQSDALEVTDLATASAPPVPPRSYAYRVRTHQETDVLATADDKTATYVPSTGPTINNVTITGANNYAAAADVVAPLRLRNREQTETAETIDATSSLRLRNREQTETAETTDTTTSLRRRDRAQADSLVASDSSVQLRERNSAQADTVAITDDSGASRLRDRSQVDALGITDDSGASRLRDRSQADAISVDDVKSQWTESNEQLIETIDPADASVELRFRDREISDSIVIGDAVDATYVTPGAVVYEETLSDSLNVSDALAPLRERNRENVEASAINDFIDAQIIRDRVRDESFDLVDSAVEQRTRNRIVSDAAVVNDAIVISGAKVISRQLIDALNVADSAVSLRERNKRQIDNATATDSINQQRYRRQQQTDSIDVSETADTVRERIRALQDDIDLFDASIVTLDLVVYPVTLFDSISVIDSIVKDQIVDAGQFYVYHGMERLSVEFGVEQLNISSGIIEETT